MEIILGLDIGKARTGIAKSDAMGIIIKPLKTIETIYLIDEIKGFQEEFTIKKFIIGKPLNPKLGNNDALEFIENKIKEIQNLYPDIEIITINEAFSSRDAESIIKNKGIKINKDNKELIDSYAAAILLEEYFGGLP